MVILYLMTQIVCYLSLKMIIQFLLKQLIV